MHVPLVNYVKDFLDSSLAHTACDYYKRTIRQIVSFIFSISIDITPNKKLCARIKMALLEIEKDMGATTSESFIQDVISDVLENTKLSRFRFLSLVRV